MTVLREPVDDRLVGAVPLHRFGLVILALAVVVGWVALAVDPLPWASAPVCNLLFLVGIAFASAPLAIVRDHLSPSAQSPVVATVVLAMFILFDDINRAVPSLLLGLGFTLVTAGCSLFGLLEHRAARRLGAISYGINLLQGPVLAACFSLGPVRRLR